MKKQKLFNRFIIFVLIFFFDCNAFSKDIDNKFEVEKITPYGDIIENLNQIAIQFNRPVIAFGENDKNVKLQIKIDPFVNCSWQWSNTSLAICYLNHNDKLKLATKYHLTIEGNLKASDGSEFNGKRDFDFSTAKPDISSAYLYSWKDYGKPVFQVNFNQFVEENGLSDEIYIVSENKDGFRKQKYSVKLLDESKFLQDYLMNDLKKEFSDFFVNDEEKSFDKAKKIIFVEAIDNLPEGENFKLVLGDNLHSYHGDEVNLGAKEVISFKTFGKPEFLGISCYSHNNGKYENIKIFTKDIDIKNENNKKCLPGSYLGFLFSSPITGESLLKYLRFDPNLSDQIKKAIYDPLKDIDKNYIIDHGYSVSSDAEYQVNINNVFPPNQLINVKSSSIENEELPKKIKKFFSFGSSKDDEVFDIFGRPINGVIDFSFSMDHYEPQLFFPNYEDINVLEKSTNYDVLITARNFANLNLKYNILSSEISSRNQESIKELQAPADVFTKVPLKIREILGDRTGLIFGELKGYPVDSSYPISKNTFMTQVTNFGIIGKIGHYNSLIFVTDLTSGNPIQNANVKLMKSKFFDFNGEDSQIIATGKTDENGIAVMSGLVDFDKNLKALNRYYDSDGLIVQVEKDGEMGWLPIRYNHSMWLNNANNIWTHQLKKYGHLLGWGFTAQGIYKAGEKIKYKVFVRNNDNDAVKKAEDLVYKLRILDKLGRVVDEKNNIKLSDFGSYNGEFQLGKNAESGWYDIVLIPDLISKGIEKEEYEEDLTLNITRFLVSDFKTSPFRIKTDLDKKQLFYGDELLIRNFGELYSGGAYSNAPISVNVDIEPRIPNFEAKNSKLNGFIFYNNEDFQKTHIKRLLLKEDKLDQKGEFDQKLKIEDKEIPFGDIVVDTNINDDSGKAISSRRRAEYYGVDRFIGIKLSDWFFKKGEKSRIDFIVTDSSGNIINGIDVNLKVEKSDVSTVQAREAGNLYVPQNFISWSQVASCNKKSTESTESCDFIFDSNGNYRVIGTIVDSKENTHRASTEFIVFDDNENIHWKQENNENFEIIPEKNEYKVGEKARFMIKNPLIGSYGLVTIERYGVIKQFTKKFDKSLEILEFDLTEKDAPGFYLSVVLTMPRILNENKISDSDSSSDMYKPIAKIGYGKILVSDPNRHIKVDISTGKETYKPNENVQLNISLNSESGTNEAETTILVIDEAILDLVRGGINYFNPNSAFTQLQALDLMNYSLFKTILTNSRLAMMKGVNQGGDAGVDLSLRANFENLAFFKESLILKKGERKDLSFKLPDNLTSWKIVVVSNDKDNLFGLDSKSFKVNKNLELRSVLPDHIVAGDKFNAGFTIFNRSDKPRALNFSASLSGAISKSLLFSNTYEEQVILEPFARKLVTFPISSIDSESLDRDDKIKIVTRVYDEYDSDGAQFEVKVQPNFVIENIFDNQTINFAEETKFSRLISIGSDIVKNLSKLEINLSKSILSNITNIFSYIKNYKYNCLEQNLSKMIVANNYLTLKKIASNDEKVYKSIFGDFAWNDAFDLQKSIYEKISDYQAENGGMTYFSPQNIYTDPYITATTLWAISRIEKSDLKPDIDLDIVKKHSLEYLDKLLRDDSLYNNNYNNNSTILDTKAVILDVMSDFEGVAKLKDILRFSAKFNDMSLFGKAKMLNAGLQSKIDKQFIEAWTKDIMQYLVVDNGRFVHFEKDKSYDYRWITHSTRYTENCSILSSFINLEENFDFYGSSLGFSKDYFSDLISKLANNIASRGFPKEKSNYLFNTHEMMICSDALVKYSKYHENYSKDDNDFVLTIQADNRELLKRETNLPDKITVNDLTSLANKKVELNIEKKRHTGYSIEDLDLDNNFIYMNNKLSLFKKADFNSGINHGIDIVRKYEVERNEKFVEIDEKNYLKNGDLVKVTLTVNFPSDRYFVVIDDYIPGCFEPIDDNLETAKRVNYVNNSNFYYKDLKQNYARFYSEFLPKGSYEVSYFVQVISKGKFNVLPAVSQEMYNEDIYGRTKSEELIVKSVVG